MQRSGQFLGNVSRTHFTDIPCKSRNWFSGALFFVRKASPELCFSLSFFVVLQLIISFQINLLINHLSKMLHLQTIVFQVVNKSNLKTVLGKLKNVKSVRLK